MIFPDLIRADLSDHLNPWSIHLCLDRGLVPKGGLEPPRVAPYAPQTYVSTSSTTSACLEDFRIVKSQTDSFLLGRLGRLLRVGRLRSRGSRLLRWLCCITRRLFRRSNWRYRSCRRGFRWAYSFSQRPLLEQSRDRKQKRDEEKHYRCGYRDLRQHRLSPARSKRRRVDSAAEHRRRIRFARL